MRVREIHGTYGEGHFKAKNVERLKNAPRNENGGFFRHPFQDLPKWKRNQILRNWKRA